MNWYLKVFQQYADFKGRARRMEFWMFTLINAIIAFIIAVIERMMGWNFEESDTGFISSIYSLVVLIPSIAVSVRRLHDVGKSGWMLLLNFIPLIGQIWLLILFITDSLPGSNQYGPNPKNIN